MRKINFNKVHKIDKFSTELKNGSLIIKDTFLDDNGKILKTTCATLTKSQLLNFKKLVVKEKNGSHKISNAYLRTIGLLDKLQINSQAQRKNLRSERTVQNGKIHQVVTDALKLSEFGSVAHWQKTQIEKNKKNTKKLIAKTKIKAKKIKKIKKTKKPTAKKIKKTTAKKLNYSKAKTIL